jgi:Mismatch repair ATPase (MutS family)
VKEKEFSPMMKQYLQMKEQYKDAVLMYRLGDFYEMFFDDAITVSAFLDLTLTGRDCGLEERAPMCGVPYHAVDTYIKRLIEGGFKVAICEQLNTPEDTKGQLTRDVVRVITPGTLVEESYLDERKNNYIASVYATDDGFGLSWADVSTGEFKLYEYRGENASFILEDLLVTLSPAEIICNQAAKALGLSAVKSGKLPTFYAFFDWAYGLETARKKLLKQLDVTTLSAFECDDKTLAISAAGALVEYMLSTQKRSLKHLNRIACLSDNAFMFLDANTRRNLELTATIRDGKRRGSLLWLLDETATSMGARNLRRWIEQPLQDEGLINARLTAVEELIFNVPVREDLFAVLKNVRDLERLTARLAFGSINPRDAVSITETLKILPEMVKLLKKCKAPLLRGSISLIYENRELVELISSAIADNPPALLKDGGYIREGYNSDLDAYNHAKPTAKSGL